MDVRLPDGTLIRDVPDGMSRADLTAKLASNGYDVSKFQAPHVQERTFKQEAGQQAKNAVGGLIRGAGSIGATLARPFESADENAQRRTRLDENMRDIVGADTDSLLYGGSKLAAEIAGTAGAGGLIAKGLTAIPRVAAAVPNLVNAVRTSGMVAGPGGGAANALTRAAGGAVAGGASAGLVNPEDAATGAVIGGAAPGAIQLAGKAGQKIGSALRGSTPSPDVAQAADKALQAGYVIPPTQVKPSLGNRLLEGYAGKLTTAQNASAKNASVTNALAAKELGLAPDVPITPEALGQIRTQAGAAYEAVRGAGTVKADQAYDKALDGIVAKYKGASAGFPGLVKPEVESLITTIRQPIFTADSAVDAIRVLREKADTAYGAGDKALGKASKEAANAIEEQLERHLSETGQSAQLLSDFRAARQLIAKTYSVEGAMNKTTGTVDARKLGAQINKGKPLSGGLRDAGEFANRFPKAANTPEAMGSLPQNSPLDFAAGGIASAAHGNVWPLVGAIAGRPLARGLALSGTVQNNLTNQAPNRLMQLLRDQGTQQLIHRSAPVAGSQR